MNCEVKGSNRIISNRHMQSAIKVSNHSLYCLGYKYGGGGIMLRLNTKCLKIVTSILKKEINLLHLVIRSFIVVNSVVAKAFNKILASQHISSSCL